MQRVSMWADKSKPYPTLKSFDLQVKASLPMHYLTSLMKLINNSMLDANFSSLIAIKVHYR